MPEAPLFVRQPQPNCNHPRLSRIRHQPPPARHIAEALLARNPKIIGFGIYIWNVAGLSKSSRPSSGCSLTSRPSSAVRKSVEQGQPIVALADHVITGEADLKFAEVRGTITGGPQGWAAGVPDFSRMVLPHPVHRRHDLAHRIVYVEASRGCPFTCGLSRRWTSPLPSAAG